MRKILKFKIKKGILNLTGKLKNWFNNKVLKTISLKLKPPRFFSESEWNDFNDKERTWLTYKHHLYLISVGESELNTYEQVIGGILAIIAFFKIMGLPEWSYVAVPPLYLFLKYLKWHLGNWKDIKDFNALDAEPSNRRNKVFREIRSNRNGGEKNE